jgi:hypothetical protein
MATMSLDNQIKKYLPLLGAEEKQSLLGVIKSFITLKEEPKAPQRLTIEQYNKELDEAEARMDAGEFYTMEEVEQMAKKW